MTLQRGRLCVAGDVRIIDGTATEGRLEVWAFTGWRAVCPNMFDDTDANVACIVLGFGYVCARVNITIRRCTAHNHIHTRTRFADLICYSDLKPVAR